MKRKPLRIITFNYLPVAYNLLTTWIRETGHKHVLAVTTPGPKSRPTSLERHDKSIVIQVADGAIRIEVEALAE